MITARTALPNGPPFGKLLSVHHQRQSCVLEHMTRNTAQDQLAKARMRIGTHYEQITGKSIGRCQQTCANHLVYSFKRGSIGRKAVRGEVLLEVRSKRSAPLAAAPFGP